MFSSEKVAAQISQDLLAINVLVNYSLLKLKDGSCPLAEYEAYRKKVSNVIVSNFDILSEIWSQYPSVMPDEFARSAPTKAIKRSSRKNSPKKKGKQI